MEPSLDVHTRSKPVCRGGESRHPLAATRRAGVQSPVMKSTCARRRRQNTVGRCGAQRKTCEVTCSSSMPDRESYEAAQAEHFDSSYEDFVKPLPDDVEKNLARIVGSCSGLGADSRVVDAGAGTGRLIPHLQQAGVKDILAVDLSAAMLAQLQQRYCPTTSNLGNEPGVRCWQGSFVDLPNYMGPVTAVFFNSVFGNFLSPRQALLHAALLLAPGGQVLITHPLGREWQCQLHRAQPQFVPHTLPCQEELQDMIADLPLRITKLVDDPSLYIACLQVPKQYELEQGPVTLQGEVVTGFGRGSRDMGTPTANVDPIPIQDQLQSLPWGVYFGWAQLAPEEGFSPADLDVHPMVLNIGARPTMDDDGGVSVEAHIMHTFPRDFYGGNLTLLLAGFLRPEMKFSSLPQLLARIKRDIGTAKATLATPELQALRNSDVFRS